MAATSPSPVPHAPEPSKAAAQPTPPEPGKLRRFGAPLVAVVLAAILIFTVTRNWNAWEGGRAEQETNDAYVRGDLTPLSTKVAGIVRDVKVADYQDVHKGDLVVELEDDDFKAQVAQATAAVAAAKASIENNRREIALQQSKIERAAAGIEEAKAQIVAAQAGIEATQADLTRAQAERTRQEHLLETKATTQQKVEQAVADQERLAAQEAVRKADLEQAKAALQSAELAQKTEQRGKDVLESQTAQLEADRRAREAQLATAEINLGYTRIEAPGDGTVGERQVRPGQLVSPGTQVITFVDKTKWVLANYRETQLTNVKVGDPAEIRFDIYPDKKLQGKVQEIAPASGSQFALLPPDNATGNFTKVTQRIPVKIIFDDPAAGAQLRPGLSATVVVQTKK
jgi:membrane fusion protein, multidrug efflux system